ncbi:MAG: DUF2490 domain-containing protein [Saprospiraceae bacterium]
MKATYLLIITAFSLQSYAMKAQSKQVSHQNLYWLRVNSQIAFSPKLTLQSEIENRSFFKHNRQHHFIFHNRLHYKFSKVEVAGGFTYSLQSPQDPESLSQLKVPELRTVQELHYQTRVSNKLNITHRFRVDERFIRKNDGIKLQEGYDFNWRLRYRILASLNLPIFSENLPTQIKLANEIMVNAGKNIVFNRFDQNRVIVAFEQNLGRKTSIEFSYINWYQQRSSGYQYYQRDISRITLSQKF